MSYWQDIPLIKAAHDGDESTISLLLSEGSDINIQDRDGWTSLMYASVRGHERVVSLLIERGVDISQKNKVNITISLSYIYL
jgi:ankyrin repeat protein